MSTWNTRQKGQLAPQVQNVKKAVIVKPIETKKLADLNEKKVNNVRKRVAIVKKTSAEDKKLKEVQKKKSGGSGPQKNDPKPLPKKKEAISITVKDEEVKDTPRRAPSKSTSKQIFISLYRILV